ncbi:hypothetical protein JTE90_008330 [Oedothorax gibbosus]|uniref:Torsin n=2 Tax=Oedothorax gibbosus TaxID=931172 RepID=A0AAV6U057_9ARAC|nr:hypothetical protein JTE90_008330 [Oedothorax gibbosus]
MIPKALGIKCVEPITTIAAAVGAISLSVGYAGYNYIKCISSECCDKNWINFNYLGLEQDLQDHVFGQHFVDHIIPRSLKGHIQNKNPKKALVMSFHGWTGCGKNHVSQIIAKNLYRKGTESAYQHLYIGSRDFAHKHDIYKYKATLRKDIEESTKKCGRSLFIFDEVDKMAPGVLDALKPYIDYHDQLDGVNYRKNIYIFLSNAGGTNITAVALKFWSEGKTREDITLKDIEHSISKGAFNEIGGLQHSEIVKRDLIDVYVPFLPLERKHVKQCASAALRRKGVIPNDKVLNKIANQLVYAPPETELYSVSGCKKIEHKVELFAD